jgi:mannose-1-phosphate guanylyltransferase
MSRPSPERSDAESAPTRAFVVIMAGGGGTRLWPHSRRGRPKQFLPILPGGETLIGATFRRTLRVVDAAHTLVVTTAEQVAEVRRCLPSLPIDNILVEPIGRNTAPCIGLSALSVAARDPDGVMAVLPADHYVKDEAAFADRLRAALSVATQGHIVTLGIHPSRPETGYGYIEVGAPDGPSGDAADSPAQPSPTGRSAHRVLAFVEKPSAERAATYLAAGNYLWNSGMFFFPVRRILAELRQSLPALAAILDDIAAHPSRTAARYPESPSISIDYAVMEKLGERSVGPERAIRVLSGDFGWNDVGSFDAMDALTEGDAGGNHALVSPEVPHPPLFVQARRNIVCQSGPQLVAALGVDDLVIAVTPDAVLILPRERAQDVREVVARLSQPDQPGLSRLL